MKRIIRAWTKASLIKRILIGMILGATLGMLFPNLTGIGLLGELFVGGLKAIAPILVFALVANALSQHQYEDGYFPILAWNLCCCIGSRSS